MSRQLCKFPIITRHLDLTKNCVASVNCRAIFTTAGTSTRTGGSYTSTAIRSRQQILSYAPTTTDVKQQYHEEQQQPKFSSYRYYGNERRWIATTTSTSTPSPTSTSTPADVEEDSDTASSEVESNEATTDEVGDRQQVPNDSIDDELKSDEPRKEEQVEIIIDSDEQKEKDEEMDDDDDSYNNYGSSSSSSSDNQQQTTQSIIEEIKLNDRQMSYKPSEVVAKLDLHIVGQYDAKRAVAIAMRNRWRRKQLPDDIRKEITPRNVLLVGPTGCGKTEVARRMAQLSDSPFIKVEATKFTEVGYHGRDVDQIIRDLADISIQLTRKLWTEKLREKAKLITEERILDLLTGPIVSSSSSPTKKTKKDDDDSTTDTNTNHIYRDRNSFREMLRQGLLDDQEIEVDVPPGAGMNSSSGSSDGFSGYGGGSSGGGGGFSGSSGSGGGCDNFNPGFIAVSDFLTRMTSATSSSSGSGSGKKSSKERQKMTIQKARDVITSIELDKLLETIDIRKEAMNAVEESGIVFIDEIDKICTSRDASATRSADASAEGVQRDLLPIVEGTTINTKHGNVNTDYILFIASGAFHSVKPRDLLPELQGRFPIRVELKKLTEYEFYRILTEPVCNLIIQQVELMKTENVTLIIEDDAIREIARMAAVLNNTIENIGARRLHTVMERIMEDYSYTAAELDAGSTIVITKEFVQHRLSEFLIIQKTDLSKYIL